jgi:UDP-N-acetylmuramoyl-L-alanyl-D-glutamate--2,6-diaminopimelate ligase
MRVKKLSELFSDFPFENLPTIASDVTITGIAIDSRVVKPGDVFVAMQGGLVDGHAYIPKAIENGASAVVGQKDMGALPVPYVRVDDPRQSLTYLAAAFYDWPGRKLTVVGVTGTDGKTTTCNLIYHILVAAGFKVGMISTVNAVIGDEVLDTGFHVTTPDAHDVQRYLAKMVDAGLTHVVLETTSHGWAQHRVDGCEFDIGVITNITHEHLDEHGSYENYRAAKARLFSSLERTLPKPQGNPRLAVLNRDDRSFEFLNEFVKVNKITYSLNTGADVQAVDLGYDPEGMHFVAKNSKLRVSIKVHLVGQYNISNCLAALSATVFGLGVGPDLAAKGIANLPGIPGRMEVIDMGQDFTAIVDFAHTPNALKVTLETAREMLKSSHLPRGGDGPGAALSLPAPVKRSDPGSKRVRGTPRIIAVFGSAGLRDKEKRRMMAETSAELADLTILTAEDPRTESLDGILDEMAAGARSKSGREGKTFWRVPDRGEAIQFALRLARPGDIVLSCGKGHEQSMCFGKIEYPWDDRIAMRAALAEHLNVDGPDMPYLPTQDKLEKEWLKL